MANRTQALRLARAPALDARIVIPLLTLLVVGFLVLLPLVVMVVASLRPPATLPFVRGPLTLDNYRALVQQQDTARVLWNTVLYAGGTLVLATPMAFGMAYLTERTDMPARGLVATMMFVPMVTPVFATALGWVLLAGPRAGTINEYFRLLTGSDARQGPLNVYSLWGMIIVTALGIVPSMWLMLVSVLRNMDPNLEDAAAASGIGRWATLRKVTAPLMWPGILAVIIYFTIAVIESFEIPLALGITAGVPVLSTKIYLVVTAADSGAFQYGTAAAFGMVGVVAGIAGIALYLWLIRRSARYAVVTGKAYRPRLVKLGGWRWLAFGLFLLYVIVKVILPFAMIVYASFLRYYLPPLPANLGNLSWTLENYRNLLDYRFFGKPLLNTALVVAVSATVTMLLVAMVSWVTVRVKSPLAQALNALTFLPLAIPGVIVTLAIFLVFLGTPLYGSLALLVLAFMTRYLAYTTRLMHAAQLQIHKELEEAALTSGVGQVRTFFLVNVRLLLPAFLNGWLWIVTHAAKDFTTPLLLSGAGSLLVANVIYGRFTSGRFTASSAAIVVLVLLMTAIVVAGRRWIGHAMER